MNTLLLLFWEFFKTGLFAVGGGLATLPFLTQMEITYPQWFSTPTLADMIAIAESTPGPIGVNAATFVGYSTAGILGAFVATFALVLPSFVIVVIVAGIWEKYRNSTLIESAFKGLRPAVTGLIFAAGYSVLKLAVVRGDIANGFFAALDYRCLILFAILFAATQIKKLDKIHPVVYILVGGTIGALLSL